jgi:hypothetical protein
MPVRWGGAEVQDRGVEGGGEGGGGSEKKDSGGNAAGGRHAGVPCAGGALFNQTNHVLFIQTLMAPKNIVTPLTFRA